MDHSRLLRESRRGGCTTTYSLALVGSRLYFVIRREWGDNRTVYVKMPLEDLDDLELAIGEARDAAIAGVTR